MSPQQALKVLEEATAGVPLVRQAQLTVMEALRTLNQAINPPAEAKIPSIVKKEEKKKDERKQS